MKRTPAKLQAAARRVQDMITSQETAGQADGALHDRMRRLCAAYERLTGGWLWL
jgi:hypothetical protein